MRKLVLFLLSIIWILTACPGSPASTGPVVDCAPNVIPLFGDSNGTQLPQYISIVDYEVATLARGGAAMTEEARAAYRAFSGYDVPTIVTQVKEYLTRCPAPPKIIIEGTTNDWTNLISLSRVQDEVSALDDYLNDRDISVVWLNMHPVPNTGAWTPTQLGYMADYNTWLASTVHGTVLDSHIPLGDFSSPQWMNPGYYLTTDIFGSVDPLHMSQAGYYAWALQINSAI